jgi:LuxR family maltose regulon positive regulatory protein
MNDMCESFIRISLDAPLMVKHWLTDYSTIESTCRIYNLGFANVVYGKYLIYNEKYEDLLAITGEMLNVAGIFNSILFKIYTYIYISICNYYLFNNDKSIKFIEEAIELASADNILIPFVENYSILNDIFINFENEKYNSFIDKVKKVSKEYSKNLNALKKAAISEQSYGLTKRETDVAKLAAKRYSNKEIAEELFIAESTVKSNLKIIYSKLGINSRNQLKRYFEE